MNMTETKTGRTTCADLETETLAFADQIAEHFAGEPDAPLGEWAREVGRQIRAARDRRTFRESLALRPVRAEDPRP